MMRLIAALLVCLMTSSTWAQSKLLQAHTGTAVKTWTLLAHTSMQGGATSSAIDTTGSAIIIVSGAPYNASSLTVTDSVGNTYTNREGILNPGKNAVYIEDKITPTVSATHTFTCSGSAFISCEVTAWSVSSGTPTFDTAAHSSAIALQPGSVTPSSNNTLIITSGSGNNGNTSVPAASGFTVTDYFTSATSSVEGGQAYLQQSTAAAVNPTWSNIGADNVTAIVTYK